MKKWQAIAIIVLMLVGVFGFSIYDILRFEIEGKSWLHPVFNIWIIVMFIILVIYNLFFWDRKSHRRSIFKNRIKDEK